MQVCIFACQHRIPEQWRPPLAPDVLNGHDVRLIQLPCSAKLATVFLLKPFEDDFDGVLVMACAETHCRSLDGSRRAAMRVREVNAILEEIGLGNARVMIKQGGGNDINEFIEALDELASQIGQATPDMAKGQR